MKEKTVNLADGAQAMCHVVDAFGNEGYGAKTDSQKYDCCSNPDTGKTNCVLRAFISGTGITQGNAGQCPTTDTACKND